MLTAKQRYIWEQHRRVGVEYVEQHTLQYGFQKIAVLGYRIVRSALEFSKPKCIDAAVMKNREQTSLG